MNRMTAKGTLPSGRTVVMRELTANDELRAAKDSDAHRGGRTESGAIAIWSLHKRALVSIDGKEFDQSSCDVVGFRDLWTYQEWVCLQDLYERLHGVDDEERSDFRSSITVSA